MSAGELGDYFAELNVQACHVLLDELANLYRSTSCRQMGQQQ